MNSQLYEEFPGIERFMTTAPQPVQILFELMEHVIMNFYQAREAGTISKEEDESMRQAVTGFRLLLILAFKGMISLSENAEEEVKKLLERVGKNPNASPPH